MTATRSACTRKCKYFVTIHQVSGEELWYTLYKSQQYEIWYRTHGFVHNTVVPSEYILGVPLGWAYRPITTNMRTVQNLTSFPCFATGSHEYSTVYSTTYLHTCIACKQFNSNFSWLLWTFSCMVVFHWMFWNGLIIWLPKSITSSAETDWSISTPARQT